MRSLTSSPPEPDDVAEPEVVHTGSISSDVDLDFVHNEAHKRYHPQWIVRLWYWLAFQARFPYVDNHYALEAARLRRVIVDLLTKVWFGHHLVARVVDVADLPGGGHDFVTRLVRGHEPERTERGMAFLRELDRHFLEAGLPTWQTTPYNPHAITNFIETSNGSYRIIDLESSLVAFMYPLSRIVRLVRLGQFPSFDDIDIEQLRGYVAENAEEIEAKLPRGEPALLDRTIAAYEEQQALWHGSERRYLPRALRFAFRLVDVPSWIRGARRLTSQSEERAESYVREGIESWVSEGRLSRQEADRAIEQLAAPPVAYALLHLGAHFAISLPLRFPLGALARFTYTSALRVKAEASALLGGPSAARARETHTLPVMLFALVPGFGRLAYVFARPLRSNPLLFLVPLDAAAQKLPAKTYDRLHVRPLIDWWAGSGDRGARRSGARPRSSSRRRGLRRHAPAIAALAAINIAVVGAGLYLRSESEGGWTWWFEERGLLDVVTATQFLLAAVAAALAYHLYWRVPGRSSGENAGIFLWGAASVGLVVFAVDDFFGIHEAAGELLADWVTGVNVTDGVVILAYVLAAAATLYLFRHELFAPRASSVLLLLAAALSAVAAGAAILNDVGVYVHGAVSNPAVAAGAWLAAAVVRLRELRRDGRGQAAEPSGTRRSETR